eukprot:m.32950 g.32950  ORF g.32950 m.32950 type:complete len:465 (+) comp8471_c0_seq1:55-1449(+)
MANADYLACALLLALSWNAEGISFSTPLFSDGMILQRGGAMVWGKEATANGDVTLQFDFGQGNSGSVSGTADGNGTWMVNMKAQASTSGTITITDEKTKDHEMLANVAVGDVLLCGGQSNMGFGMCGAQSKTQTPAEALGNVSKSKIRFYFQSGSGPNGGTGVKCNVAGGVSRTTAFNWFTANATNSGGASANCLLTAQYLAESMPDVPIGAVESCVGGTPVGDWTPPSGILWQQHMVPLLPMTFKLALWDQGEADAKRTNSTWYSTEFPKLITGWRSNFEVADMPFFYVELCTEYGAEEPKEDDFWLAQRSALKLPFTGFATTTDIQRALHPPDKQDVAQRLLLEIQRVVYGQNVVSRGPEVTSQASSGGNIVFTMTNSSLVSHAGIFVGTNSSCGKSTDGAVMYVDKTGKFSAAPYTIQGNQISVPANASSVAVKVNSDMSQCFIYSSDTGLPAPPVEFRPN